MEKLATWAFAGLLAYICVILTSIDSKIDALNMQNTQVAMLNEVKPQSFTGDQLQQVIYEDAVPFHASSIQTGFVIAAILSVFISWHLSRIYHFNQWTKRVLQKSFAHFHQPQVKPKPSQALHPDQECIDDAPLSDGRIKSSWLPPHAQELYAAWTKN